MKKILKFNTKAGTFYISQSADQRFHVIYDNESFGSYLKIGKATSAIANNETFSILHSDTFELLDTSKLQISEAPSEWIAVK